MKIVIDDAVCSKHKLNLTKVLGLLFVKQCCLEEINPDDEIKCLLDDNLIFENRPGTLFKNALYFPVGDYNKTLDEILAESDSNVPKMDVFFELADEIRMKFPKGKFRGTNQYYRGNTNTIANKLKKWWRIYNPTGKYSFSDIIDATDKYIKNCEEEDSEYSQCKLCSNFIMKSDKVVLEGGGYVDQTSTLADILENKDSDDDSQRFMGF